MDDVPPLARVADRLGRHQPLRIVALGSSTTSGFGTSSPDKAYPSLLKHELERRFPDGPIEITNGGVNGQLASDMFDRLYRDAITLEPDLVIWQTGTNDALSRVEMEDFYLFLSEGIDRLVEAGIDVVLVDPQFFPGVRNEDSYERYVEAMRAVAEQKRIPLLPRYAIMRHWALASPQPVEMLAWDRFHLNDLGHYCITQALTEVIARGASLGN